MIGHPTGGKPTWVNFGFRLGYRCQKIRECKNKKTYDPTIRLTPLKLLESTVKKMLHAILKVSSSHQCQDSINKTLNFIFRMQCPPTCRFQHTADTKSPWNERNTPGWEKDANTRVNLGDSIMNMILLRVVRNKNKYIRLEKANGFSYI